MKFLHEIPDARQLFEVIAHEKNITPSIVEKDYWIMHCLWGLQQQGYQFELKGGTSLSKGFNIIQRFSEDIDIHIHPKDRLQLKTGKNHDKQSHIEARGAFFEKLSHDIDISGLKFSRDHLFDDTKKLRSAGIRGNYISNFSTIPSLKPGILLELGFDQTTPNLAVDISSWALQKALDLKLNVIDNTAHAIKCYLPEYTLIEKLQAISTKYRHYKSEQKLPINFLRHYYDTYQLLQQDRVKQFIGSREYIAHKTKRFRSSDESNLLNNPAFTIEDKATLEAFSKEFHKKSALYFNTPPDFSTILTEIQKHLKQL